MEPSTNRVLPQRNLRLIYQNLSYPLSVEWSFSPISQPSRQNKNTTNSSGFYPEDQVMITLDLSPSNGPKWMLQIYSW
jgi:hypothetical protein